MARADELALDYTARHGARAMDLLHVASALQLGVTVLLSFDKNQCQVAQVAGLKLGV